MKLTKTLLREELTIFDNKIKLTKETLNLIENQNYVKYVLGIDYQLNENQSFETKQLILQEALNIQTLSQSIKKYVGDKVDTVVTGVKDIKDVLSIIYKIATDKTGELAIKGYNILNETINETLSVFNQKIQNIINQFGDELGNAKTQIENIKNHVADLIKKLGSYKGLVGILGLLAFATLLQWINQKIINVAAEFVSKKLLDKLTKSLNSFGGFFKEIFGQLDIQTIISYFKNFDNVLGPIVNTAEIITIMAVILRPIVQRFNLKKKVAT